MRNLQEVLSCALGFHAAVEAARADGKLDLADAVHLAGPLLKLPAAVEGMGDVVAEFKALSDDQRAELLAALKAEYDLADDVLEAKVEDGLDWLMATGKFVGSLRA